MSAAFSFLKRGGGNAGFFLQREVSAPVATGLWPVYVTRTLPRKNGPQGRGYTLLLLAVAGGADAGTS